MSENVHKKASERKDLMNDGKMSELYRIARFLVARSHARALNVSLAKSCFTGIT